MAVDTIYFIPSIVCTNVLHDFIQMTNDNRCVTSKYYSDIYLI